MGRGHRGAGFDPITAVRDGAVDQRTRSGDAPVFGDAALVVLLVVGLIQPRHRQPVTFQFRLEVRQRRAHAGIRIAAVAGAEHVDHAGLGHIRRRVQPGTAIVVLGVGRVQVTEGLVADVLGLAAPAVVDGAHAGVHQGAVHRLEILGVRGRAEQEAVIGVGVADIHLCVVRHPMHAHAVALRAHGAGDVGTVGVVVRVERARGAEGTAIDVRAAGGDRVEALFGRLGVIGIEPRIQRADFHALAADSGGIGFIGLHTPQAPIALVFGGTPTGGVTRLAGLGVLRLRRNGQQQQ
ncbi:hypothetical protein [Pseudomonas sp. 24 E 13]|nr:hypothetical protein [Pseudomonas sp. 24 E 13]